MGSLLGFPGLWPAALCPWWVCRPWTPPAQVAFWVRPGLAVLVLGLLGRGARGLAQSWSCAPSPTSFLYHMPSALALKALAYNPPYFHICDCIKLPQ